MAISREKRSVSRCWAAAAGQILFLGWYSLAELSVEVYDLADVRGVARTLSEGESSVAGGWLTMACPRDR